MGRQHFKRSEWLQECSQNNYNYREAMITWASLVAQTVKNLPAVQETWIRSLDREDSLEEGMATRSSILAWRITWTEEPGKLQSIVSQRVRHDWNILADRQWLSQAQCRHFTWLSALNNCSLLRLPQCSWNMVHTCFVLKRIFIVGISTSLVSQNFFIRGRKSTRIPVFSLLSKIFRNKLRQYSILHQINQHHHFYNT